ncbi:hypothetical protein MSWAN_0347 [Methanobacterium paludis]|uniref:Uncharacterized protein n=1 Tax=Methanobacterium paludis (strain DSM 25820 / JCM 18151 / SWAN1) TaxID=868131 RepID=F6D327_METPW|nr:hypothetical protein MSWAN_0347 [Methanobacterium paludis]
MDSTYLLRLIGGLSLIIGGICVLCYDRNNSEYWKDPNDPKILGISWILIGAIYIIYYYIF